MPPLSRGYSQLFSHARIHPAPCRIPHARLSTRSKLFTVAEEVQEALATGKPVVALETTIYTHGYPYPENVALASHLESLVRLHGGVPATIGIVNGKAHVGMRAETLIQLISTAGSKDTWKISRRDLGFIGGAGLRGKSIHGGTTIAGTMILAHLAGIKIFATGGLGGVHRGGENSLDISADLTELGRTPVAVVSSGCKSFLDIPRTLEYLETQGVGVGTFADGRTGIVDFPAFFSRDSGTKSPQTIETEADAAAVVHAQFSLPVHSGLLFANPVPREAAMARADIDEIIVQAVAEAEEKGISGSANTPYILKRIRELSNGASVKANQALIESNVIRGTKVAVELAKLELQGRNGILDGTSVQVLTPSPAPSNSGLNTLTADHTASAQAKLQSFDILVAGALACDTMCDYKPFSFSETTSITPTLHTSNPAEISQSAGGVGRNVALASTLAGAKVAFASVVADDIAGYSLIGQVEKCGLDSSHVHQLKTADGFRTAQYVAINNSEKDLVVAMADMGIFSSPELEACQYWTAMIDATQPRWMVIDANWSPRVAATILSAARSNNIPVALEPVSTAKASRIFDKQSQVITTTLVVPHHAINLVTPNMYELKAMHDSAREAGLFETDAWWTTINNFGLSASGSREKFIHATNIELVDQGVPQQCIQLLPYLPCIATKLGSQGVLLTSLLKSGDERLSSAEYAPYILSHNDSSKSPIGGVYMRLFAAAETVPSTDIISVNGVGDTLLGVLMAGIVRQDQTSARPEDYIQAAQRAAVMTLKSREAVAPEIKSVSWF